MTDIRTPVLGFRCRLCAGIRVNVSTPPGGAATLVYLRADERRETREAERGGKPHEKGLAARVRRPGRVRVREALVVLVRHLAVVNQGAAIR